MLLTPKTFHSKEPNFAHKNTASVKNMIFAIHATISYDLKNTLDK